MSGRRAGTTAIAIVLVGMLVTPLSAGAQTDGIVFPPGSWEGSVFFGGSLEIEGFRGDNTHYLDRRTVAFSSITFEATVGAQGQVVDGEMTVDIRWSGVGTGTTPVTGGSYRITSEHRESGTLTLEGTADRLVASGSLTWEKFVYDTDGNYLEEVSGVRDNEVGWVFQASEVNCGMATGRLIEAWGSGLMVSAQFPPKVREGTTETRNELVSVLRIWSPDETTKMEALAEDIEFLNEMVNELLTDPTATPTDLAMMVSIAESIRARLASDERCVPGGLFVPESGEDWLAAILQNLLSRALETPGDWTAQELIYMLNIGVRGGAVDTVGSDPNAAELYDAFEDALDSALDEAIASSDLATIIDIAAAAARYGYSDVYETAAAVIAAQP